MKAGLALVERGLVPDSVTRRGIRSLIRARLRETRARDLDAPDGALREHVAALRNSPIAVSTEAANDQHYEVPASFFRLVLGPHLKYSGCLFEEGSASLAEAERAMLELTCHRAELADGQDVLELGCGWGSLTLWMAERYPNSRIHAVSNSHGQRDFILARAAERGLGNVHVTTADMNAFRPEGTYDRVVSVEMFEHMRNYAALLERVATWMRPGAKLFVHVFCHREFAYFFETNGAADWMGRHFFTGGQMPSETLLLHFQEHVVLEDRWRVCGTHYARTAEAWLANLDRNEREALEVLAAVHGADDAPRRLQRWRVFFMACAELFGYAAGTEWPVAHYRFARRESSR